MIRQGTTLPLGVTDLNTDFHTTSGRRNRVFLRTSPDIYFTGKPQAGRRPLWAAVLFSLLATACGASEGGSGNGSGGCRSVDQYFSNTEGVEQEDIRHEMGADSADKSWFVESLSGAVNYENTNFSNGYAGGWLNRLPRETTWQNEFESDSEEFYKAYDINDFQGNNKQNIYTTWMVLQRVQSILQRQDFQDAFKSFRPQIDFNRNNPDPGSHLGELRVYNSNFTPTGYTNSIDRQSLAIVLDSNQVYYELLEGDLGFDSVTRNIFRFLDILSVSADTGEFYLASDTHNGEFPNGIPVGLTQAGEERFTLLRENARLLIGRSSPMLTPDGQRLLEDDAYFWEVLGETFVLDYERMLEVHPELTQFLEEYLQIEGPLPVNFNPVIMAEEDLQGYQLNCELDEEYVKQVVDNSLLIHGASDGEKNKIINTVTEMLIRKPAMVELLERQGDWRNVVVEHTNCLNGADKPFCVAGSAGADIRLGNTSGDLIRHEFAHWFQTGSFPSGAPPLMIPHELIYHPDFPQFLEMYVEEYSKWIGGSSSLRSHPEPSLREFESRLVEGAPNKTLKEAIKALYGV